MDFKEFQKLPIGTIFLYNWNSNGYDIEVKISKSVTTVCGADNLPIREDTKYLKGKNWTKYLSIAPKWMQKCFEVK